MAVALQGKSGTVLPCKATAMIYFSDVMSACDSVPALIVAGCEAIELMDRASLESIRSLDGVPNELAGLLEAHPSLMAILCEFHSPEPTMLRMQLDCFHSQSATQIPSLQPVVFTQDPKTQARLWKLRKGMYPAVAAVRARGEAAILEDIAVPVKSLGPAILDLQSLFIKHGYRNGIVFGHAKDGNLHFVITQSLDGPHDVEKYARFIDDLVELVVHRYEGSLKAEHGTGRNMAPFVETEWGAEALAIMRQLKDLTDPHGILNPDVILTKRPALHTQDLKSLPVVEDVVDRCIECGACEPRCPSKDFTLTPRQRIVLRRAVERLKQSHAPADAEATTKEIERDYLFSGLATCATDGLCSIDCPVHINTGDLVKQLRKERTSKWGRRVALFLSSNFGVAESLIRLGIRSGMVVNRLTGKMGMPAITSILKRIIPAFPQWHASLSTATLPRDFAALNEANYVYVPACMSRMMGGTADALCRVARRTKVQIALPTDVYGSCCGQAFSSKGYVDVAIAKQSELIARLWRWSDQGRLPIVIDLGSCTAFLRDGMMGMGNMSLSREDQSRLSKLVILDSIEFAADVLLPKLSITKRDETIALHALCANQKHSSHRASEAIETWEEKLDRIGNACAKHVIYPHAGNCCGMGGDRGFAIPELATAATSGVAAAMDVEGCNEGFTSARSCAIGLATASGKPWRSVFHLLDATTQSDEIEIRGQGSCRATCHSAGTSPSQ